MPAGDEPRELTMQDVRDSVRDARARLGTRVNGYPTIATAMCRISLPMADLLLAHIDEARGVAHELSLLLTDEQTQVGDWHDTMAKWEGEYDG